MIINWNEMQDRMLKEFNTDIRDYADSHNHFDKWCDARGYGKYDSEGKHRGSSKIWYAEYKECSEGEVSRPQYLNFWHQVVDVYGDKVSNPCTLQVKIVDILKNIKTIDTEWCRHLEGLIGKEEASVFVLEQKEEIKQQNDPTWKIDIFEKICKMYPNCVDENGCIEFYIEW